MDYNYNYSNAYGDPYFTQTSFDSDTTNPAYYNFNQPSMPDWSYPNQKRSVWSMDHHMHWNNYSRNPYHKDVKKKNIKQPNKQTNKQKSSLR